LHYTDKRWMPNVTNDVFISLTQRNIQKTVVNTAQSTDFTSLIKSGRGLKWQEKMGNRSNKYFLQWYHTNPAGRFPEIWTLLTTVSLLKHSSSYQHWTVRRKPIHFLCHTQTDQVVSACDRCLCWTRTVHWNTFINNASWEKCHLHFCKKCLKATVPRTGTGSRRVETCWTTGSVAAKEEI